MRAKKKKKLISQGVTQQWIGWFGSAYAEYLSRAQPQFVTCVYYIPLTIWM